MNFGKLKRVAIKEFKRSPGKTGFLLVMIPVALYFCIPLLVGAIKKSSPPESAAAAGVVSKKADFVLPAATNAAALPSRVAPSWVEVTRSLENDVLAAPAGVLATTRNPFAARQQKQQDEPLAEVESDEREVQPDSEAEPAESAESSVAATNPIRALGLELNATMVGKRSRLATINGKTYEAGETISVAIDLGMAAVSAPTVPVELTKIERRFVVLKMDGHEHRLGLQNEIPADAIIVKPRVE